MGERWKNTKEDQMDLITAKHVKEEEKRNT